MKHLHLAAAQHAAQWHASAAEVHDIRAVGIGLGVVCVVGLIRTIVVGTSRSRRPVEVARTRLYDAEDRFSDRDAA